MEMDDLPFLDALDHFPTSTTAAASSSSLRRRRFRLRLSPDPPIPPSAASDPDIPPESTTSAVEDIGGAPVGLSDLLLKAISFYINLPRLLLSIAVDPLGALASAKDWALGHVNAGHVAVRAAAGLFWASFVGSLLVGCLLISFVIGDLATRSVVEEPVRIEEELVFDYTKESPVASVQVGSWGRAVPVDRKMALTVLLTLPESEYNQRLGMFQVRAEFLSSSGGVIATSSRPCMLPFKSSLVRFLQTLWRSGPLLAGYTSETEILRIKMKDVTEKGDPTAHIRIFIQSRAEFRRGTGIPEIYSAILVLESELPFYKRILWNWRKTIFIWISLGVFLNALVIMLLCCKSLILPKMTMRRGPG